MVMLAHGWIVVQPSHRTYTLPHSSLESDNIDEKLDGEYEVLWSDFCDWVNANFKIKDQWDASQFLLTKHLNNHGGLCQFQISRNHRSSALWEFLKFASQQSKGTYGLIYVHDDEDTVGNTSYGRGANDYSKAFRVWRILEGKISEHSDPFFPFEQSPDAFGSLFEKIK